MLHVRPKQNSPKLGDNVIVVNDQPVPRVSTIRFLGAFIDDDLKGTAHIANLKRKLIGGVAALCRACRHLNEKTLLLLYHAFFSSHLTYGIEVFGLTYKNAMDPIVKLQKKEPSE